MKKVLAVILAAMLILAVAGCSSEQEKTSENTENKTEKTQIIDPILDYTDKAVME